MGIEGEAAAWLCEKAGLNPALGGCISDCEAYESVLNVKLHCLLLSGMQESINTPKGRSDTHSSIYITFNKKEDSHDGHFHTYHWVNSVSGTKYFCDYCLTDYASKATHICSNMCYLSKRRKANPPIDDDLDMGGVCITFEDDCYIQCKNLQWPLSQ